MLPPWASQCTALHCRWSIDCLPLTSLTKTQCIQLVMQSKLTYQKAKSAARSTLFRKWRELWSHQSWHLLPDWSAASWSGLLRQEKNLKFVFLANDIVMHTRLLMRRFENSNFIVDHPIQDFKILYSLGACHCGICTNFLCNGGQQSLGAAHIISPVMHVMIKSSCLSCTLSGWHHSSLQRLVATVLQCNHRFSVYIRAAYTIKEPESNFHSEWIAYNMAMFVLSVTYQVRVYEHGLRLSLGLAIIWERSASRSSFYLHCSGLQWSLSIRCHLLGLGCSQECGRCLVHNLSRLSRRSAGEAGRPSPMRSLQSPLKHVPYWAFVY